MNDGSGLGWPGEPTDDPRRFSTGLGWPDERDRPQREDHSPQADGDVDGLDPAAVSRETSPLAVSPQVKTAEELSDLELTGSRIRTSIPLVIMASTCCC